MDKLYLEIQGAMPAAAASWMSEEAERNIKDNSDAVQSLGIEKLKILKSKLNALTERLPEIVVAEFQDRNKWPHHVEWKEDPYTSPRREEPHFNKLFRNVISNLGALLNEFGLIKDPKGQVGSWTSIGQGQFRYAINPGAAFLSESKVRDYNALFEKYISLSKKIKETRKSLSEAKAKELWDRA